MHQVALQGIGHVCSSIRLCGSVQKNQLSEKAQVMTLVYQIAPMQNNANPFDFGYVLIDPIKRTIAVWCHRYVPLL